MDARQQARPHDCHCPSGWLRDQSKRSGSAKEIIEFEICMAIRTAIRTRRRLRDAAENQAANEVSAVEVQIYTRTCDEVERRVVRNVIVGSPALQSQVYATRRQIYISGAKRFVDPRYYRASANDCTAGICIRTNEAQRAASLLHEFVCRYEPQNRAPSTRNNENVRRGREYGQRKICFRKRPARLGVNGKADHNCHSEPPSPKSLH